MAMRLELVGEKQDLVLYVLMRTDLGSLTPGKAMAQACHVGGQLQKDFGKTAAYKNWSSQACGFGTTIVLDGVDEQSIMEVLASVRKKGIHGGLIMDETYPVQDGEVVHLLPITTCGFILIDRDNEDHRSVVDSFELLTRGYVKEAAGGLNDEK